MKYQFHFLLCETMLEKVKPFNGVDFRYASFTPLKFMFYTKSFFDKASCIRNHKFYCKLLK